MESRTNYSSIFIFNKSKFRLIISICICALLLLIAGLRLLFSDHKNAIYAYSVFLVISPLMLFLLYIVHKEFRTTKYYKFSSFFRYRYLMVIMFPILMYVIIVIIGFLVQSIKNTPLNLLYQDNYFINIFNVSLSLTLFSISIPTDFSKVNDKDEFLRTLMTRQTFYGTNNQFLVDLLNKRTHLSLNQFRKYYELTLFSWILSGCFKLTFPLIVGSHTCTFICEYTGISIVNVLKLYNFTLDFFFLLSILFFSFCVLVIAKPTVKVTRTVLKPKWPKTIISLMIFGMLVILIIDFYVKMISTNFYMQFFISIIIGICGGLLHCIFTGRVDSKFINMNGFYIILLYCFSFIITLLPIFQMNEYGFTHSLTMGLFISDSQEIYFIKLITSTLNQLFLYVDIVITNSMLFFKILMGLLLIWLTKSNKLFLYMLRMNHLQFVIIRNDRKYFNQIKKEWRVFRTK